MKLTTKNIIITIQGVLVIVLTLILIFQEPDNTATNKEIANLHNEDARIRQEILNRDTLQMQKDLDFYLLMEEYNINLHERDSLSKIITRQKRIIKKQNKLIEDASNFNVIVPADSQDSLFNSIIGR